MRTFEYRLYPTRDQRNRLMVCLVQSRALYNEMLEWTKAAYEGTGKFLFKYDLSAAFKGRSVEVPAYFTSQKCSGCGELVQKSLSVRTHVCSHCGLVADRDHNAARNILRAGAQPSEDNGGNACRSSRSHPL